MVFAVILIAGYIIKDRIKEWGKRYVSLSGGAGAFDWDRFVGVIDRRGGGIDQPSLLRWFFT